MTIYRGKSDAEIKEKNDGNYETKESASCPNLPPAENVVSGDGSVRRSLEQRHISMIAIGGTIGTGLFLGMGEALHKGGPVGLVLGYIVMGFVVYAMTVALGEMVTMFPISGSFTHYPCRFVDPALGFAVGWNYWYSMTIAVPSEIIAAAIVMNYWHIPVHTVVWLIFFTVTCCGLNFFGVKWYGESEFACAALKVTAVVVLIIVGIVIDLGGAGHERIGLRNFINPGPFKQLNGIPGPGGRFLAFWTVFIQASYSFLGTEMVAITAGEAANPRKTVPKAVTRVFYRILVFYIGSTTIVGLLVPSNSPDLLGGTGDATSSPFVIAIKGAGIRVLPDLINVVILVSAFSTGSSKLYGGSRVLFGLAKDGMAPRIFGRCTKAGLPIWALVATCSVSLLSFMSLDQKSSVVFNWFQNLSAMTGLLTWWSVLVSYLFFYNGLKNQGFNRNDLHYKAPFQPYMSYFGLTMISLIILMCGFDIFLHGNWSVSEFLADYLTLPIFVAFYLYWKISKRTKRIKSREIDFVTGTRELDEMDAEERLKAFVPVTKWDKFMDWLL
ncbi:amino acid permease/ SLC12A domain-containing protein [Melampsora americana]|nr:amino acid permease/ SLC12A domain-containing protein [Melampsora americana]KAH9824658.1 amino acid permease/ SLC12A domain-containing protein [Melampsora americana]